MSPRVRVGLGHWLLRVMLSVTFTAHALGKLSFLETFNAKFGLPVPVSLATAAAELAGVAGLLTGGLAAGRWFGPWLTRAGAAALVTVQIGAIAVAHWPFFLYYEGPNGGSEFSLLIITVCAALALMPRLSNHRGE